MALRGYFQHFTSIYLSAIMERPPVSAKAEPTPCSDLAMKRTE